MDMNYDIIKDLLAKRGTVWPLQLSDEVQVSNGYIEELLDQAVKNGIAVKGNDNGDYYHSVSWLDEVEEFNNLFEN